MPESAPQSMYAVNVTAIYDSAHGAHQATEVLDRLNAQIQDDIQFNLCLWRTDLLELPEVYELARKDAAASMLLTVICVEAKGICPELEALADEWCEKRAGTEAALAVLLCGNNTTPAFVESLRLMAARNGLDFICSKSPTELHDSLQAPEARSAKRPHHAHKGR